MTGKMEGERGFSFVKTRKGGEWSKVKGGGTKKKEREKEKRRKKQRRRPNGKKKKEGGKATPEGNKRQCTSDG